MSKKSHFKIKYPRLILVLITYIIACLLFKEYNQLPFHDFLLNSGYYSYYIMGFFYVYEFTAAPATALFLLLGQGHNIWIAAFIAGLGALVSDILLFLFIKKEMAGELNKLSKTPLARIIKKEEKKLFGRFKKYVLNVLAAILIASPLPTEIGVSMLSTEKNISPKKFIIIAYILHTLGILAILALSKII